MRRQRWQDGINPNTVARVYLELEREGLVSTKQGKGTFVAEREAPAGAASSKQLKSYETSPVALHLRAMNMLFEGLKERGAMVIVPSSAVDTMNLGGLAGLVSLGQSGAGQQPGAPSAQT